MPIIERSNFQFSVLAEDKKLYEEVSSLSGSA